MRKAEVAGAASLLLGVAAIIFLSIGPLYQTAGVSCSSSGACVTFNGAAGAGWHGIFLVPLIAAGLVLAGAVLNRWTTLSVPVAALGCSGLAVITFLGLLSIGVFLFPTDAAAVLALVWISNRRASA